jgi:endonuclease-3
MNAAKIIEILEKEYGTCNQHEIEDPVDVLIRTILSQNTSEINSQRAFSALKTNFSSWQSVASAPVERIAEVIKCGGLFRVKAARIKKILEQIETQQGSISLDFLRSKSGEEAKTYLMHLPGVGYKTASCVLLFSLGKAYLPIDTHIFRVAKRLGLVDSRTSVKKAHELLQEMIPEGKIYQFHLQMIRHGRQVCRAHRPRCERCALSTVCPSAILHNRNAK